MLNLVPKKDRFVKASIALTAYRETGATTKHVIEANKMKDIYNGGRLQVQINVYELTLNGLTVYLMADTLGRAMAQLNPETTLDEIKNWLVEHGYYLSPKEFYMKELGMTEDAWEQWNQ